MESQSYEPIVFDDGLPLKIKVRQLTAYRLRWHSYPELLFVVKGSIDLHINQNDYLLKEHQIHFINSGELFSMDCTAETNLLVEVQIDGNAFPQSLSMAQFVFERERFYNDQNASIANFSELRRLIANTVWHYNKRLKGYSYQIVSNVCGMIAWLNRYDYLRPGTVNSDTNDVSYQRINDILKYMNDNYDEKLTLTDIAEREHFSYYYLSSLFTRATGMSFRDHLTKIRLQKSIQDLRRTRKSVKIIASKYGFPSVRSYAALFAKHYGTSPAKYRESYLQQTAMNGDQQEAPADETIDYNLIYSMMDERQTMIAAGNFWHEERVIEQSVDKTKTYRQLKHIWSMSTSYACASNLLYEDARKEIHEAHKELGFEYIRFHNLLGDEMMICKRDAGGKLHFNWLYVDKVFDFIVSIGMHPFIELSFMPTVLASADKTVFKYKANITPPARMEEWQELINALVQHCVNRYGLHEIEQWRMEVWNAPDYKDFFWTGSQESYFELYRVTAETIKKLSPRTQVGGPAISSTEHCNSSWMNNFIEFCQLNSVPPDFISFHTYTEVTSYASRGDEQFPVLSKTPQIQMDKERDMISSQIDSARAMLNADIPFYVTEWNISPRHIFCIRDTCFMATYIIRTALGCADIADGLIFWSLSDIVDEFLVPSSPFHGGMGLITTQGIPKAGYNAMWMLNQLGTEVVAREEDWILTRSGDTWQLLMFDIAYLDQLARQATDWSSEFDGNVYTLFEEKPALHFNITLNGFEGGWQIRRYELNRHNGSSYDTWKAMGSTQELKQQECEFLKASSKPKISIQEVEAAYGRLVLEAIIPANGCQLITMVPLEGNN